LSSADGDGRRGGLDTLVAGGVHGGQHIVVGGSPCRRKPRIGVRQPVDRRGVEPGVAILGRKPALQVVAGNRVAVAQGSATVPPACRSAVNACGRRGSGTLRLVAGSPVGVIDNGHRCW
jgi:hypothetical protein